LISLIAKTVLYDIQTAVPEHQVAHQLARRWIRKQKRRPTKKCHAEKVFAKKKQTRCWKFMPDDTDEALEKRLMPKEQQGSSISSVPL